MPRKIAKTSKMRSRVTAPVKKAKTKPTPKQRVRRTSKREEEPRAQARPRGHGLARSKRSIIE
jgi:hypothetical protein